MYTFKEIETIMDPSVYIDDIREYDVPYHVRVSIDRMLELGNGTMFMQNIPKLILLKIRKNCIC